MIRCLDVFKTLFIRMNENMFQWDRYGDHRSSKYQNLIDYVAENKNCPKLLEVVNFWKIYYPFRYFVFNQYFKKRKTFEYIKKTFDFCDNTKTKAECRVIYATLEIPLNLEPVEENVYIKK